jgi:Xaa-Pro aminopeptidase
MYTDVPGPGEESISATSIDWLRRANAFPVSIVLLDIRPLIGTLRVTKDEREIELIRKATNASIAAHLSAMHAMKPGITEREISALIRYEWGKRGCGAVLFADRGIRVYSTVLHYCKIRRRFNRVICSHDAAGEYSMYASDITRTSGNRKVHRAPKRNLQHRPGSAATAIAAFQSGKSTLRRDARTRCKKLPATTSCCGKDLHGEPLGKYFIHGLSHYVGLGGMMPAPMFPRGREWCSYRAGIYIGRKIGVRIEDALR